VLDSVRAFHMPTKLSDAEPKVSKH